MSLTHEEAQGKAEALVKKFGERFEEMGVVAGPSLASNDRSQDKHEVWIFAEDPHALMRSNLGHAMSEFVRPGHLRFCYQYKGGGVGGAPIN